MRTYDLSPLHRFTVGFDNVSRLMDAVSRLDDNAMSYPPYNIERFGEDRYRISMAVAGFSEDELDITVKDNALTVTGRKAEDTGGEAETTFLHRGIASRAFERRFELAAHIKVKGASLENGLLHIALEREVPEELKPRKIEIAADSGKKAIGGPKAA